MLTFYYQPKVCYIGKNTYSIYGYEALLRKVDQNGDCVLPYDILQSNKDNIEFDKFIVNMFSEHLTQTNCFSDVNVSLNVHPIYIENLSLSEIAKLDSINCGELELEILESSMVKNFRKLDIFSRKLSSSNASVILSWDDFGRGYTSLERIFNVELIKVVKLDRLLTQGLIDNDKKRNFMCSFIKAIKEDLGLKIIAEGIEDYRTLSFLRNQGVEHFQGYLFSKPVPYEKIATLPKSFTFPD